LGPKTGFAVESGQIRKNQTFSNLRSLSLCTSRILVFGCLRGQDVVGLGRASSGGALAPQPPRATRSQLEAIRICAKNTFPPQKFGWSLLNPVCKLGTKVEIKTIWNDV